MINTSLCYIERGEQYLMLHRVKKQNDQNHDKWIGIGGKFEPGESPEDCVLREVREESGVQNVQPVTPEIYSLEVLPVTQHIKRGKFVSAHLHLNLTYLLQADEHEMLRCKPDENSGVRWFCPEAVCAAVSEPAMRVIYQKLMDKLHTV